jgi:radical SAM protein with 4Fe4S-binding SPASM domain
MLKVIDSHKLMYHPERIWEWISKGDCAPIYVEVGPTNRCNHRCMFCALDYLEHGVADIDSKVLYQTLEDMAQFGVKAIMFAGEGEPFLHKDTPLFIQFAKHEGIDVSVTSNGVVFDSKKAEETLPHLSWIRFSVDAGTPETYSRIHGTREEDFQRLTNNIKQTVEIKRRNGYNTTIGVQALLTNKSIYELQSLGMRVKELGVDNFQIKPYSHHPSSKNDLSFDFAEAEKIRPALESLADRDFQVIYRTQTIKRLNEERNYAACYGLPFFSLIDSKGNVIPCNLYYGNSDFYYGNIGSNTFSEIWRGEKRKEVLGLLSKRGIKGCRRGCRLDVINRYLEGIKTGEFELKECIGPKPSHVNFI